VYLEATGEGEAGSGAKGVGEHGMGRGGTEPSAGCLGASSSSWGTASARRAPGSADALRGGLLGWDLIEHGGVLILTHADVELGDVSTRDP